jgi:polyisoprenoid-binding protein YceI
MRFILGFILAFSSNAFGAEFTKSNNTVSWHAVGTPGFLRIDGKGGAAEGVLNTAISKVSGVLTVALSDYKTGISLRDEHMKSKYLDVGKYPTAKLEIKDQPYAEGVEGKMAGVLTLKDVSKPVTISFKVTGKKVSANFKINIRDYPSIGVPVYLGVTVADEVEITVDATTTP